MFCRAEGLLLCHLLFFRAKVQLVKQNIDVLVREGLGGRGESDLLLVREVCVALIKLTGGKKVRFPLLLSPRVYSCSAASFSCLVLQVKVGTYEEPSRYASDHEIFVRLKHIMITSAFTPCRMLLIGILHVLSVLFLSCRRLQRPQPPLDCNG